MDYSEQLIEDFQKYYKQKFGKAIPKGEVKKELTYLATVVRIALEGRKLRRERIRLGRERSKKKMNSNPECMDTDDFIAYLEKHNITEYKVSNDEITFPCPFNDCDVNHKPNHYHCSFNTTKCVYQCWKCGETGNFVTLQKHFGDYEYKKAVKKKRETLDSKAERWHKELTDDAKLWLYSRGINNESIERFKLGYGEHLNKRWITIPILDKQGKVDYFKLRRTDDTDENTPKYMVYPNKSLTLYGIDELVNSKSNDVLICEGEFDRITAIQNGIKMPVITAGGARAFKDEWIPLLKSMRNIYICMDADETGESAADELINRLSKELPNASIYKVTIPPELGPKADITDYFFARRGTADELISEHSEWVSGVKPIDASQFMEMGIDDIAEVLSLTIKYDKVNKVIVLIAMLLAYTEKDQLNIVFNAESSTGKSYICNEVSKLFPENDIKIYGRTTPTAFYYNENLEKKDPETGKPYIDLERRILIFTEQPNMQLLANLRSFLSHDSKKTNFSLTNKGKGGANKAVDAYILGFASTFFCSAYMRMDEQEQTRCLVLSPESSEEKIRSGVLASVIRNRNKAKFDAHIASNEPRRMLMDRILYIKNLQVDYIDISEEDSEYLLDLFYSIQKINAPRNMRDVEHFMSLAKGIALINAPFRMVDGKIIATRKDIDEAMKLWSALNESMAYGVPPQILDIYKRHILPAYYAINEFSGPDKNQWGEMTLEAFKKEYYKQNGIMPNLDMYRKAYIPMLEGSGLISYEDSKDDKRKKVIKPQVFFD